MFRKDNTSTAVFAAVLVTPSSGVEFAYRNATSGAIATIMVAGKTAPLWTRVIDNNGTFSGYYSTNGSSWTLIGSASPTNLSTGSILAGLASASGSTSSTNVSTATYSNFTLSYFSDSDIGTPGKAGSLQAFTPAGLYTVAGGGAGVTGTTDQFNFASESWSGGSGFADARVVTQSNTNFNAQAGVMFRATNAANSSFGAVFLTPSNGVEFVYRSATNGAVTTAFTSNTIVGPVWVKVSYNSSNTTVSGYYSANGSTWTQIGTAGTVTSPTLVGLAVSSYNNSSVGFATFSNVDPTHLGT